MPAGDPRMVETGDDGETVFEMRHRGEIFGEFVNEPGLLRDERIAVNAEGEADEEESARFLAGFSGMGDAAEGLEPWQAEGDASTTQEVAPIGEGGMWVHGCGEGDISPLKSGGLGCGSGTPCAMDTVTGGVGMLASWVGENWA